METGGQIMNRKVNTKVARFLGGVILCLALQSCAGALMGAGVDTAIEVVKVPFKLAGSVVDLVIPGDDEDES